jgi:hypothetical protein
VSVDYATEDGTAKAGQDYKATSGTMTFEAGEVLKSLTVPILNDTLPEPAKTFRVRLSNPSGGGVLSSPSATAVTIQNTDRTFQFDSPSYVVREEAEFVQIGINQGDNNASATVDFTTTDVTAIAGVDYVGSTNTVRFGPGERLKLVRIPIVNNRLKQAARSFRITLGKPSAGTALGNQQTATVQIRDNDPGVGFTTNTFFAWRSAGVAKVSVAQRGVAEFVHGGFPDGGWVSALRRGLPGRLWKLGVQDKRELPGDHDSAPAKPLGQEPNVIQGELEEPAAGDVVGNREHNGQPVQPAKLLPHPPADRHQAQAATGCGRPGPDLGGSWSAAEG